MEVSDFEHAVVGKVNLERLNKVTSVKSESHFRTYLEVWGIKENLLGLCRLGEAV